ncbi:MAG: M1 family metallopeptidase [Anaerolineae bacterium]
MSKTRTLLFTLLLTFLLGACSRSGDSPGPGASTTGAASPTTAPTQAAAAQQPTAPKGATTAAAPGKAEPTVATAGAAKATDSPKAAALPAQQLYMPRSVKAAYDSGTRSPDGKPGPKYWQNHAAHDITIDVTPPNRTITGTQVITYTNNSPNALPAVLVRLYQNAHLPQAVREQNYSPDFLTSGIHIDEFRMNGEAVPWEPWQALPFETVKAIILPKPIQPGESAQFSFKWHYDLGQQAAKEGVIDPTTFFIGYFFPRISVYSDTDQSILPGWDVEEFTYRSGRELNNDFADFKVAVNVPKNYVVWATGDLQNPDEVLQPTYAARLKQSFTSDEVTNIARPEDVKGGKVTAQTDTVTWRWKAENVPDFVLGLSDHYVWDAGSVVVDPTTKRRASVQAAYGADATRWREMVKVAKEALAFGSTEWPGVPYPYSKTTAFVGGADEEYPMMINDSPEGPSEANGSIRFVAAHELLHSYFPFYMGVDERRYPMMDEGWTTAFEYLFNIKDLGKEEAANLFKKFRVKELVPPRNDLDIPIITPADALRGPIASSNAYGRAALGYLALKDLMGEEAFKKALLEFMARWNGKRPLPWDMFNTFNSASGQDLTWFFQNWFFETNYMDSPSVK